MKNYGQQINDNFYRSNRFELDCNQFIKGNPKKIEMNDIFSSPLRIVQKYIK